MDDAVENQAASNFKIPNAVGLFILALYTRFCNILGWLLQNESADIDQKQHVPEICGSNCTHDNYDPALYMINNEGKR